MGSLRHVLCGCRLNEEPQSRITWRHDSILLVLFRAIYALTLRVKKSQAEAKRRPRSNSLPTLDFVTDSKVKYGHPVRLHTPSPNVLEEASDWKVQFDINAPKFKQSKEVSFPAEIGVVASQRPDGLIWSNSAKILIWVELTSPWEELAEMRHFEKKARYNQLSIDLRTEAGWKVHELCIEVGCRGHVGAEGWHSLCRTLGFTKVEKERLKERIEETARHCSHAIFVHRYKREWAEKPLLDVAKWHEVSPGPSSQPCHQSPALPPVASPAPGCQPWPQSPALAPVVSPDPCSQPCDDKDASAQDEPHRSLAEVFASISRGIMAARNEQ